MARRHTSPLLPPAIVAACVLLGASTGSAASLGGLAVDSLGAGSAVVRQVTGVQLDWTVQRAGESWQAESVRITADPGQEFTAGSTLRLTLDPGRASPCQTSVPVAQTVAELTIAGSWSACAGGPVLDAAKTVAVAITNPAGTTAAVTGRLGDVVGTLSAFSGVPTDPGRSIQAGFASAITAGVSYLSQIRVTVPTGATAAGLVGAEIGVALSGLNGFADTVGGTISADPAAPVHVDANTPTPTIFIDPRAGRAQSAWVRTGQVTGYSAILYGPQHLGSAYAGAAPAYALTTASGSVAAGPSAATAVDAVNLDSRLAYSYPSGEQNWGNSLGFCHTFTVTNTSAAPVDWTLSFDTSLSPLWGADPTAPGLLSSAWGFRTVSYDPGTHLWTIAGESWNKTLQPGQSATGGYCASNVPEPAPDPSLYTVSVSVDSSSNAWNVALLVHVTSTSAWNVPWQAEVDLARYVCPASLAGKTVSFDPQVNSVPVPGSPTRYTITGTRGDTRYVSTSQSRDFAFAYYNPGGATWQAGCP